MLFLVISTPRPDHPTAMIDARTRYWDWIRPLLDTGRARSVYAKVGRGAVALFDVGTTAELHRYINEWGEIIPAHHEIIPLLDEDSAKDYLEFQRAADEG